MLARVAGTLLITPGIARVVVTAQEIDRLAPLLPDTPRLSLRRSHGTIAETVHGFAQSGEAPWPLLVTTADHVLLSSATLTRFLDAVNPDDDVAVALVSQRVVGRRFPNSQRTWLRFSDGKFTGANLFALTGPRALRAIAFWADVEQDRKKGWRLLAKLGPWLLLRALLRTLTLGRALEQAGKRIGVRAGAVALDDPLAAVDVDKPADLALATAVIEGRA